MSREPGGGGHHVLLGDPALDEAVRVRELEAANAAVRRQVGIEHDQLLVPRSKLEQSLPVRLHDVLVGDLPPYSGAALRLRLETARGRFLERLDGLGRKRVEPERG